MDPQQLSEKRAATAIVTRVEDSHQRIRRDLEALAECEKVSETGRIADELVSLLKEHFHDEEKPGGLFDELELLKPSVEPRLDFLRGEHQEIMRVLEDLRTQIREAEAVHAKGLFEQRADHIRTSAAAFVQLIHHHERIESDLVSEAYYTEDGGRG